MRRVLHIIDSLDQSSLAAQTTELANGLAQEGFEVELAVIDAARVRLPCRKACGESSRTGLGEGSSEPTIRVTSLGRRCTIDPLAFLRMLRLFRTFQPNVVHTWGFDAALYAGGALTRLPQSWRGRIRAWGAGDSRPRLVMGAYRIEPWRPEWQVFVLKRIAHNADQLVTSSPNVRKWYRDRGWPGENVPVIPSGVPPVRPSDVSRTELLRELELPEDARLIGVIGRLVPENRVKDLIWAADLLRVLHNNVRLLILGGGPLRAQLEEYARLASDLDHIRFLGDRPDAWRIVPHLNVLWNGAENAGQSREILEAMAAGVPVVASDTPCNRELVVENETGYLIPLGTRVGRAARARHTDRIFTDAELSARLSRGARERATHHFSARRELTDYWDMYSRICS
jgi:glycosyltransferase involved in cell wall biosynthesis